MAGLAMDVMAARFADRSVRSVFIYTHEAHPGEGLPRHTSMDVKRAHARAFRDEHGVTRPILLDTLDGDCHRAFGGLSNMSWIMGRGGVVLYKAAWTEPDDIEAALADNLGGMARRLKEDLTPTYTERMIWHPQQNARFIELSKRAGHKAILDMYGRKVADDAFGED